VGQHRLDLLVEGTIVVELKGDQEPGECSFCHCEVVSQGQFKKEHGLPINFAKPTLEVKRVICQKNRTFPGFLAS